MESSQNSPVRLERESTGGGSPLRQIVLARVREFYREPEALFWSYGFPILMTVALGIAFLSVCFSNSVDRISRHRFSKQAGREDSCRYRRWAGGEGHGQSLGRQ